MQRNFVIAALIAAVSFAAHSQQAASGSDALAVANGGNVTVITGDPAPPAHQVIESRGSLKTTGSAFVGAAAVASGGFNCGASGGAAIGVTGWSFGAQGAKSLRACVLLHIAVQFPALAEAALCQMDEGKDVMAEAGVDCPSVRRENAKRGQVRVSESPAGSLDPELVARLNSGR